MDVMDVMEVCWSTDQPRQKPHLNACVQRATRILFPLHFSPALHIGRQPKPSQSLCESAHEDKRRHVDCNEIGNAVQACAAGCLHMGISFKPESIFSNSERTSFVNKLCE